MLSGRFPCGIPVAARASTVQDAIDFKSFVSTRGYLVLVYGLMDGHLRFLAVPLHCSLHQGCPAFALTRFVWL
ncbi:hypothetical protein CERSUDRAFT_119082, partial [Gelatoporia subvermispora B]